MVQKSQTTNHLKCKKKQLWKLRYFFRLNWCRIWSIGAGFGPSSQQSIHFFLSIFHQTASEYLLVPFGGVGDVWGMIIGPKYHQKNQGFRCPGSILGKPKTKTNHFGTVVVGVKNFSGSSRPVIKIFHWEVLMAAMCRPIACRDHDDGEFDSDFYFVKVLDLILWEY